MKNKSDDKQPIIIKETLEMANWMHPQNDERKKLIEKQVEASKKRYLEKKKTNE